MRTLIFTAWDQKYFELAKLTAPLMMDYANRIHADFLYSTKSMLPASPDGIYWTKFGAASDFLRSGYDRFIWLDADQFITKPDFKFDLPAFGFHVSKDWGFDATEPWHFSVCGFVAHRDCIPLFEEVLTMEPESRGKPFPEQEPMRQVVRKRLDLMEFYPIRPEDQKWNAKINVHPSRFLNAVPNEVCPGKVVEPWKPGDFAAHLTMLDVPKRIELFHEIKRQAGI